MKTIEGFLEGGGGREKEEESDMSVKGFDSRRGFESCSAETFNDWV